MMNKIPYAINLKTKYDHWIIMSMYDYDRPNSENETQLDY